VESLDLGLTPHEADVGQSIGRSVGQLSIIPSTTNMYGFCIRLSGDNETNATHQRLCAPRLLRYGKLDKKLCSTEDDLGVPEGGCKERTLSSHPPSHVDIFNFPTESVLDLVCTGAIRPSRKCGPVTRCQN